MHDYPSNVKITYGIPCPVAYYTAAVQTGVGVDMARHSMYDAIVEVRGATQWQGALTVQVAESTDNSTFSTAYLATATLASATTHTATSVEVNADKMTDGYRYLRVEVTPAAGTGNMFSVVNLQRDPRY